MTQPAYQYYSYAEYLALEEEATERHEYYRGEIFVMSGGKPAPSEIAANIITRLNLALESHPCHIYSSDLRVKIEAVDYSTYADVTVVCGELEYYQDRLDVITNPLLTVEVLSPSTRNFDQVKKFEFYRYLPSFEHYLIVDPDRAYVEYYQLNGDFWLLRLYSNLAQMVKLQLPHGEVELTLAQIYNKITFPPPAPPKQRAKRSKKKSD